MDEQEKPPDNLLRFTIRQPGENDEARPPVIRKRRDDAGCKHFYAEVDEDLWRLHCQDCNEQLDPISFLLGVVAEYEHRDYKYKKIEEFESEQRTKRERDKLRRERKSTA